MGVRTIRSKVAGVSFPNRDGSDRQTIIRRFCQAGMPIEVRLEPDNPVHENALALWVRKNGLFGSKSFQIGYVRSELADELRELLVEGCEISAHILEVTGGGGGKYFGLNIELRLENAHAIVPDSSLVMNGLVSIVSGLRSIIVGIIGLALVIGRLILALSRVILGDDQDLLAKFSGLSPSRKIALAGSYVAIVGIGLWTLGYAIGRPSGAFSLLRPSGVVILIVGLGIISLGMVFSFSESPEEINESPTNG